MQKYLFQTFS